MTIFWTIVLTSIFWIAVGVFLDQFQMHKAHNEVGEYDIATSDGKHKAG